MCWQPPTHLTHQFTAIIIWVVCLLLQHIKSPSSDSQTTQYFYQLCEVTMLYISSCKSAGPPRAGEFVYSRVSDIVTDHKYPGPGSHCGLTSSR